MTQRREIDRSRSCRRKLAESRLSEKFSL